MLRKWREQILSKDRSIYNAMRAVKARFKMKPKTEGELDNLKRIYIRIKRKEEEDKDG